MLMSRSASPPLRSMTAPLLLALALSVAAVGCGGETVIAVGGGPPVDAGLTDVGGLDSEPSSEFDDAQPGGAGPAANLDRELLLLHDTSKPIQIAITESFLVHAKIIDYSISGPGVGVLTTWEIIEADDPAGDAQLTTQQATTDANGEVAVTFRANFVPNVHYTVRVAANGAEAQVIEFFVTDAPRGDLSVSMSYEGPINIQNVHLRLFEGSYTCGQFNPTNVPETPLAEKTLLGLDLNAEVEWSDLPASQQFTVVATAQSPSGSLAAAGCLDGIVVIPADTNHVTLTMYLLTLNPAGTYQTRNVFDFTGAVPGELGLLVDQIVLLFNDPGKFLIDQVKVLVSQWVGTWVTDLAFGLFEDELADIISDWMLNQSPEWMQDIFTIGNDLTQIVDALEMLAELKISKLHNNYYVQGTLYWQGIALYWHLGCAEEGEPDYDPDCGRFEFGLQDFQDTAFPMDIVEGKFTGSIQDFDHLDIDNHTIKINYGKLIIFVLNEMILPTLTGTDNLTDAVLSFIDCASIAGFFSNGVLDAIGATEAVMEGFCIDGITFIVSPVEIVVGSLALDSQLRLQGSGTLVDSDSDLWVDEIIDGVYVGNIEVDGQEGPQFDGTWEAWK